MGGVKRPARWDESAADAAADGAASPASSRQAGHNPSGALAGNPAPHLKQVLVSVMEFHLARGRHLLLTATANNVTRNPTAAIGFYCFRI